VDDDDIIRRREQPGTHHVAGSPCNSEGWGVVIRPPHVQYRVTELQCGTAGRYRREHRREYRRERIVGSSERRREEEARSERDS
jgi:hypothetical protein